MQTPNKTAASSPEPGEEITLSWLLENPITAMACIPAGGTLWRVNRCPSCGAERRMATWNKNTDPHLKP
jgi:Zn ribbon nucleic-acid-binding protein